MTKVLSDEKLVRFVGDTKTHFRKFYKGNGWLIIQTKTRHKFERNTLLLFNVQVTKFERDTSAFCTGDKI